MFPQAELIMEKIITDDKVTYSSGGTFSYLNLLLYLVKKLVSRKIAILCAKVFAIELDRKSQSSFIMFNGQNQHIEGAIKSAQEYTENNAIEKIRVKELAGKFAIGRRNFKRRLKKSLSIHR